MTSLVGCICFVGYTLLSLYIGNGLITLPYNLILQWWERPKKLTQNEMTAMRSRLKTKLETMIDIGRDLKGSSRIMRDEKVKIQVEAKGFFSRMWGDSGHTGKLATYTNQFARLDKEVQIYRLQMDIQKFDPVMPLVKVILGGFAIVLSILVFLNM